MCPGMGKTDSIYDSGPDPSKFDLDVAGNYSLVYPDGYLGQRCDSGRGSFSESLSSITLHTILADPFAEVSLPNPIGSSSWFRPLSTTDRGALNKGPPLGLAKHQWTIHHFDTHTSSRSTHIIHARSILAWSSAAANHGS